MITELNRNDVLLGRGTGPNTYIGNKRFRHYVDTRKQEYSCGTITTEAKAKIAQEVVDHVHELGGRFVRQVKKGRKVGNLLINGRWVEETKSIALGKAKQALREKFVHKQDVISMEDETEEDTKQEENKSNKKPKVPKSAVKSAPVVSPLGQQVHQEPLIPVSALTLPDNMPPCAFPPMFFGNLQSPAVDARILLFQRGLSLQPSLSYQLGQNAMVPFPNVYASAMGIMPAGTLPTRMQDVCRPTATTNPQHGNGVLCSSFPGPTAQTVASKKHGRLDPNANVQGAEKAIANKLQKTTVNRTASLGGKVAPARTKEDEMAAFLLSSLAVNDRPVITEEQFDFEKTMLTNEQRAAALADVFGRLNVDDNTPQAKRAKRDLDRDSIDFLIRQMKLEIERIPESKKQAMMEAQAKCRREEFIDSRLEKFLRCEGMNAEVRIVFFF